MSGRAQARLSPEDRRVTRSSGDVFLDLAVELSPEDRVKIEIAHEITRVVTAKKLTQVRAAELMGTDQAKVSQISRGLLDGFSAGRLVAYLLALGIDVNIRTKQSSGPTGRMTFNHHRVAAAS